MRDDKRTDFGRPNTGVPDSGELEVGQPAQVRRKSDNRGAVGRRLTPLIDRMLANTDRAELAPGGCWIWRGPTNKSRKTGRGGYGIIGASVDGEWRTVYLHRVSLEGDLAAST